MTERRRGWVPPALAVAGLLAAGLAAAAIGRGEGFGPGGFDLGLDLGPADPVPAGARERGGSLTRVEALGEFSFWTVIVVAALLAAPTVVLMIKVILRAGAAGRERPAAPPGPEPEPEAPAEAAPPQETRREVRRALHAGLAGLDTGDDPRRAVIACWLRLERAAAAAGTPRAAADTSADLVARLLAAHRVGEESLDRLAEAYRRARYGPQEVDDSLREQARRALARVDAELAAASE
ncbi:DUF4129 domain-containing protein, partial [Planobispora takensis]